MKYLITNHKDEKERKEIEDIGLYCYDLRLSDLGNEIATIEKRVLVNRVGSIITNEKIKLGDKFPDDFIDYEEFTSNNTSVDTIEELLSDFRTRQLDDNIYVLDLGFRREEPIALVEKTTKYGKEYIIGFNYKITDNKIVWGYGYYYDTDKSKAMKDFKKVLAGGNLADTFKETRNKKYTEKGR